VPAATVNLFLVANEDFHKWGKVDGVPHAVATADAEGFFLVGPAEKAPVRLRAEAPGFAPTVQLVPELGARVDLILDVGGTLRTRVLDVEGTPIPEATVVHQSGMVTSHTTTDAEGRAVFETVPTGEGTLIVAKRAFSAARKGDVAVLPGETRDETVVLSKGLTLTGSVAGAEDHRPRAGASVVIQYSNLPMLEDEPAVVTGTDGRFRIDALSAPVGDNVQVQVDLEGHAPLREWKELVDGGSGTMEVALKLTSTEKGLEGRVIDAKGSPVANATVWQAWNDAAREITTDEAGRFEVPGITAGHWFMLVAHSKTLGVGAHQGQAKPKDQPQTPVEIQLSGVGAVEGRVVRGGEPVEGALVRLEVDWRVAMGQGNRGFNHNLLHVLHDQRRFRFLDVTDAEGRFAIEGVPVLKYRLRAEFGLDQITHPDPVEVREADRTSVELTLGDGATIEGRIVDAEEKPVPGAWVHARLQTPGRNQPVMRYAGARSQSDGTFVLRGITEGQWQIHAGAPGFAAERTETAEPGAKGVVMRMKPLGWIEGVLYESGSPYRGTFTVSVSSTQGNEEHQWMNENAQVFNTDDGTFRLRNLAAGDHTIRATTPEGAITPEPTTVTVMNGRGTTGVVISLMRGAQLIGTVLDDQTRGPVAGGYVWIRSANNEGDSSRQKSAQMDALGRFVVRGLPAGDYIVQLSTSRGLTWTERVTLAPAERAVREFVMLSPGAMQVYVTDPDGNPVANARPLLVDGSGQHVWPNWQLLQQDGLLDGTGNQWQRAMSTDESGVNMRHHLPPGRYTVSVHANGHKPPETPLVVDVVSGRVATVHVVLQPNEG
jgi:protocatechuate 3,4-dioxygenase beta subunit